MAALGWPALADAAAPGGIEDRTAPMESREGLIPLHIDREEGRIYLEVDRLDEDLLYLNTLATGLGTSSPLLDRGQVGVEAVVRFQREGPRVLLVRRNVSMEAAAADPWLDRSVEESFPWSVLAAFPVDTEEEGRLLVDATDFVLSDVYDVQGRLARADQGRVELDRDRSHVVEEYTRAFPENSEIRAALTYGTDEPSQELARVTPDARSITVQQHHSFVELPESPMQRRAFDPRAGIFSASFWDFAQGFDGDYRGRYLARWRLEPSDPAAYRAGELVEPVEPIVYYLDPGVPEPYRTAFIEGGLWWNEIFEAAGFRDAFRIEDLPEKVDPMDARYSVIQWVHRTRPGPSVGPSYRDPRTGEILKAAIRMDSHRSLVNYNIYRGLLPALGDGEAPMDAEAFTMARRRQHSAHEIGHTLGVAHNFLAASQGRSSVMDYPFPLIDVDGEGGLDLSRIYREGGGAHDSLAVAYAYTVFESPQEEEAGLDRIVQEAVDDGLRFITGGHAAQSSSHPAATQWVEGSDMLEALDRTTRVRDVLLASFDERAIEPGEPMALLNQRFAHVYLHHRYALEGAVKYLGGMEFTYALRGDGQEPTRRIPPAEQRQALAMVLDALEPEALAVPEHVPDLMPPSPFGWDGSEVWIESKGGTAFDPLTPAWSLAAEVTGNLLHPERATRVVSFHARDPATPSLDEVLGELLAATWEAEDGGGPGMTAALRRVAQRAALDAMLDLAGNGDATAEVQAITEARLDGLARTLEEGSGQEGAERAHRQRALRDIERYFAGEDDPEARPRPPQIPLPWP